MISSAILALVAIVPFGLAVPVERLFIAPLSSVSSVGSCASYHGLLPLQRDKQVLTLWHLPSGCEGDRYVSGLAVAFAGWAQGRVVWQTQTIMDSEMNERAGASDQAQQVYYASEPDNKLEPGVQFLAGFEDGASRLIQIADDSILARLTLDPVHRFTEIVTLSAQSLPRPYVAATSSSSSLSNSNNLLVSSVSDKDRNRLVEQLAQLHFSPSISKMIAKIGLEDIKADVRYLTGENQDSASSANETFHSRHSMNEGALKASTWLLGTFLT